MGSHRLHFNPVQTEYGAFSASLNLEMEPLRNLEAILNPQLCSKSRWHLWLRGPWHKIHLARQLPTFLDLETLLRLTHSLGLQCTLHTAVLEGILKLQQAPNMAAQVLPGTVKKSHVTPLLWAPAPRRLLGAFQGLKL